MNITEAIAFVIEDQRDNMDPAESATMTDLDLILHVRNILSVEDLVDHGPDEPSFEAYTHVLQAPEALLALIVA